MKIHASGEDYLEAVLILQKKQGMVRSIDLARHMGFSKPSISHAVGVLRDGGFPMNPTPKVRTRRTAAMIPSFLLPRPLKA